VTEEDCVTITCVYKATPAPTFTWYKDQETITLGDRYRAEFTSETVTLTIPKSVVEDSAEYSLKLENPVGSDVFKVTVTVLSKSTPYHW